MAASAIWPADQSDGRRPTQVQVTYMVQRDEAADRDQHSISFRAQGGALLARRIPVDTSLTTIRFLADGICALVEA